MSLTTVTRTEVFMQSARYFCLIITECGVFREI